jgi:hypothetical protein
MAVVKQQALEARELLNNPAFQSLMEEIRSDAVGVFLDASCDITRITSAHDNVRAVQTIFDALQARLDAEAIEDKKDRDRASD